MSGVPRFVLRVGEAWFADVVSASVTRDLEELCSGFELEVLDTARTRAALPGWWRAADEAAPLAPGQRVEIQLDGEVVLKGWIDRVSVSYAANALAVRIAGRDLAADLVDCAAAPLGPAEFAGLLLPDLCARLCAPFGLTVRAEVPCAPAFPRFGVDVAETCLSAMEKAARQRAVLLVSDGVGGIVVTRGGQGRAPAPLRFGEGIHAMEANFDWTERFGLYLVKGQARGGPARPPLDRTANPLTAAGPAARPAPAAPAGNRPAVVMTGRAEDPAVTRYRPSVEQAKSQGGGASVAEQAQWRMRTARARSESLTVTVADWRAGDEDRLWRANERVLVDDPLSGASAELLVAAVTWRWSERDGATTELRLCGCDAFDVLSEAEERATRRQPARRPLDGTPNELTAAAPPVRSTR